MKKTPWIKKIRSLFYPITKTPREPFKAHYDLDKLFEEVNSRYFEGKLTLSVNWYGRGISRARRSIRLAYYNQKTEGIKVSRLLNDPDIPQYFLSYVIYHEILHHIYPPFETETGRRKIHHAKFLEKEKEYHDYTRSQEFLIEFKKMRFRKSLD